MVVEEFSKLATAKTFSSKLIVMTGWLRKHYNIFFYEREKIIPYTVTHTYRFQIDSLSLIDFVKYGDFEEEFHIFL